MSTENSAPNVKTFLTSDWSKTATYCTRTITIFSSVAFFLSPILSSGGAVAAHSWYQRAHLANAATSALRLRHRISQSGSEFQMSQQTLQMILAEDSLHYLIFSIMFLMAPPVTVALVPICCFAFLHCLGFTDTLLAIQINGATSVPGWITKIRSLIAQAQSQNMAILRVIAINEIILMVISIVVAISGRIIFMPFCYYQFLKLRYSSRRNPYSRQVFAELRMALNQLVTNEKCPQFAKSLVQNVINLVSRLCPPVQTA